MARPSKTERMLTAEERDALAHLPAHPVADYATTLSAIRPAGAQWTWQYRDLKAPRMYDTAEGALEAFESCLIDLMEHDRADQKRT